MTFCRTSAFLAGLLSIQLDSIFGGRDADAFFEYVFLCALHSRRCGLMRARCEAARVEKIPVEAEMKTETSDFQDYGEDERALGGSLVDVAGC